MINTETSQVMKITAHLKILGATMLLLTFSGSGFSGEISEEASAVATRLISALEAYNKRVASGGADDVAFFDGRKMLTKSLKAALRRDCHLDADPFLSAQDTVEGFLLKDIKMGDGVARVTVIHKGSDKDDPDNGTIFIMLKEDGLWKIDDIDWGNSTLKGSCR